MQTSKKDGHFNESIVNEEILEDMKKNRIDHMKYLPDMEQLEESDVMDQVISAMKAYDYDKYTEADVRRALAHDNRTPEDFQALLSPAALPLLEEIAQQAQIETRKHFGNSVYMFTPIYIANYCENYCIYCGFNCHNKIRRAQLNEEEIEKESEEETEEDEVESKQVSALFDAIAEELEWDFDEEDEEEKPKTVEELVKYFKEVIEEQSTPEYASEDVAKLDEFVRNGGKLEDYFSITPDIDVDNVDIENENEQKIVLRELLARKGYSDKQIAKKIERFEDAGVLEDEARDAVEELQEIVAKEKEELLEQQRIKKEEMVQRQQKFFDDVVGEIKSLDNIRGIKIPAKDKKELLAYIFKADASGKTQYQKDYSKSVKNLIESAYFTMRGDTLLDAAKKQGTSSAIKNLKNSLRSTGVSKGTKRINTSSSNSIFSRAVQLL